jgi:hypothetical protein
VLPATRAKRRRREVPKRESLSGNAAAAAEAMALRLTGSNKSRLDGRQSEITSAAYAILTPLPQNAGKLNLPVTTGGHCAGWTEFIV